MKKYLRRLLSTPALILYLGIGAGVIWLGPVPVTWQTAMLAAKLSGRAPEVTLSGLAGYMVDSGVSLKSLHEGEPCPALSATPIGDFWIQPEDAGLLEFLVAEQVIAGAYRHEQAAVREGDVVFDVGSHVGVFTRMALRRGAKTVVAIEPVQKNLDCFKKTFQAELAAGTVRVVEAAAWNEPATLQFHVDEGESGSARGRVDQAGTIEVPAVTIDATVAGLGLDRVDFIKMDIEGAERFALKGASETIARFRPKMAICVYHTPDDRTVIPEVVRSIQPNYAEIETRTITYFH